MLVLLLWLAVMGYYFHREILPDLIGPESPASLLDLRIPELAGEEWLGIFYSGEQVGYAHTSFYPSREEGTPGTKLENTIRLELPLAGRVTRVRVRTFCRIGAGGTIDRLEVSASLIPPSFSLEGRLEKGEFRTEVTTPRGNRHISIPLPRPVLPLHLLTSLLPRRELRAGETFTVSVLDPLVGLSGSASSPESLSFRVMEAGREGQRLRADYRGLEAELTLDPAGKIREVTTAFGWALRIQTLAEVTAYLEQAGRPGE